MPDPVLSDVPPSTEATLTVLLCHINKQNITFQNYKFDIRKSYVFWWNN